MLDWERGNQFGRADPPLNLVLRRYRREALVLGCGALYILACAFAQHVVDDVTIVRFLDNVRWSIDCILATSLTYLGWREAATEDRRARYWFFLGWLAYAIGQVSWNTQVAIGWNPFPGPSDLFYLSLPLFLCVGFLTVLFQGLTKGETRAVVLDLASIVVMSLTLTLALYLPLWGSASGPVTVTAMLYPVLYLTALGISLLTILTRKIRLDFGTILTIVSLVGFSSCWLMWNLGVLRGDSLDGSLIAYATSVSTLLSGAGLGQWSNTSSASPAYTQWSLRVQRLFPLLLVLGACVALVYGHHYFKNIVATVIDIGAATMIVLAAVRQSLVLYEQDQILEAERKLRETERHLQQVVSNSSDLIYGVSIEPDGTFRYNSLNAAGERLGLKVEEFVGKTPHECFPRDVADHCVSNYRECAKAANPTNYDLLIPTPAGMVWFETSLASLKDDSGDVSQIYAIARNITARKADMEAMASLNEELEKVVQLRTEELGHEKQKTEQLLLNVLPSDIAEELKKTGKVEPQAFRATTVVFTDFVDFTAIAESLSASELVRELDRCFREFDNIIDARGIEKLKTIGDSYMFAAGIPSESPTHAVDCILAALEMRRFMKSEMEARTRAGKPFWEMRIGVHTGPVMGGVIGNKKFAYDIWGDTVNTASRMESSGLPGQVNVSQSSYEAAREFFEFEPRGKIATKRKGQLEMFIVRRIRPELADEQGRPNSDFWKLREGSPMRHVFMEAASLT